MSRVTDIASRMIKNNPNIQQTLLPGQALTFDLVKLHSGCGEYHREGSSAVKMRCSGIYELSFHANIGGTVAGPVQLALQVGGETLQETTMISTAAAVGDLNNVGAETRVRNCCGDYDRVTVVNTGTSDVVVGPNAALVIGRRSGS